MSDGDGIDRLNHDGNGSDKDTLYMLGGLAMVVFGAGLILTNPFVRRYTSQLGAGRPAGRSASRCRKVLPASVDVGDDVSGRRAFCSMQMAASMMRSGGNWKR